LREETERETMSERGRVVRRRKKKWDNRLHSHADASEKDDLAILTDDDFFVLMKYNKMGQHHHLQGDHDHLVPGEERK
jgi:hypothetical protein